MFYLVMITGYIFQLFNKKTLFYMFATILLLLAYFRYGIGQDYFAYEFLYSRLQFSFLDEIKYGLDAQEIGFRTIGSLLKGMGFSYQLYLAVFATINILYIVKLCKRYSKNPTLSLFIFFCFYYLTWVLSGIRQGVVIAVGLYYLLRCIEQKKTLKFIVIVFLLSLIHSSVIVLLILYFASKIKFTKRKLIIITVFCVVSSMIPIGFLISKLTWLPYYYRLYPYLELGVGLNMIDFKGFGRIVFLVIAFLFYNQYCKQNEISEKVINMYIVGLLLYFLFQFAEGPAARLSIYGRVLDILVFANILYLYKEKINRLLYIYAVFALCLMTFYKESGEIKKAVGSESIVAPYVNVINKDNHEFTSRFNFKVD
jgi:EpsG family